jgi:hypothetical protein
MQITKSKPIGKDSPRPTPDTRPDDTPEKEKPELDQERPGKRSDFESERSFHDSNKRSDSESEDVKGGPS